MSFKKSLPPSHLGNVQTSLTLLSVCRRLSIVERLGGFWCCKGKTFIWIVQGFWKKSVEMEVIFNSCWVLEIQNEVSTNQIGSSTNHIGRFGGLDVISGIIGDRFIDPKK